jgi:hypothetical protein
MDPKKHSVKRELWVPLCLVVVSSTALAGRGQSLAGAARDAEEQRRQAGADTPSYANRDLDLAGPAGGNREARALILTWPLLQRYGAVRTAILRAMVQSPELAGQVRGAIGRAGRQGVEGLEREYGLIPQVAESARAGGMNVHEYVVTEVAFMIAVGVLAGTLSLPGAHAAALGANMEFLKGHQQEIAALFKEASSLEQRLAQ